MTTALTLDEVRERIYRPVEGPRAALPRAVDVVIVGAGPIGLTVANLLGGYGVDTLLIEANRQTSNQPRAIVLDDEFMRLLDTLGLAESMKAHLVGPVGVDFYSPLGFKLAETPGFATTNGFSNRSCMAQPMFEKVLFGGARTYACVSMAFGTQLRELTPAGDSVRLLVHSDEQGEAVIAAKFVVACDGSHSFVRRSLGLKFPGSHLETPRLVVDLAEFPDQSLNCHYRCNPARPINSIPAPYGGRRLEIMLDKDQKADDVVRPEFIRSMVARYTSYSADNLKIARAAVYDFSARVADRMSVGRVFLLGDAAHIMPPSGGQGLNTGGRDAANLAWKIAAVLDGTTSLDIMESFHRERWEHVKAVVAYAVRLGDWPNIRSWRRALLRDIGFAIGRVVPAVRNRLTQAVAPRPYYTGGLFLHRGDSATPMVGRIMPRLALRGTTGAATTLDQLAPWTFALVGIDVPGAELDRLAAHRTWRTLGAPPIGVWTRDIPAGEALTGSAVGTLEQPETFRSIEAERGRILVVRPDRYVALTATPETFAGLSDEYGRLLGLVEPATAVPALNETGLASGVRRVLPHAATAAAVSLRPAPR